MPTKLVRKSNNNRVGILATGNELTEGDILNTNSHEIAHVLNLHHLPIGLHITTSDDETDMENALKFLLKHHCVIIITGGLGPTSDDRTRFALSRVLHKELIFDENCWQNIRKRIRERLGREAHPTNRQQALFPAGSEIIPNPNGTAAGCFITHKSKMFFMLPGPPKECLPMFTEAVLPQILTRKSLKHNQIKFSWHLQGASEGEIAAQIDEAIKSYPATTGYRFYAPFLEVKIYTHAHDTLDEMLEIVEKIIAPYKVTENK